ncbi:membrane protein [Pseudomonas syringae CC1557]|uniref:Membrane protein n=1 Tax=Pseudomonas syringae CC1557 TaxID=1357279 RepID=W0MVS8_PSESX|nr:MFS transporter [Pseudomonas syringae]AHG41320.1 membrane protein [Pseudomonas syringae CC1557]
MQTSSVVTRRHLCAALALGSVAVLMVGLQPLLLGELLAQGHVSLEGVGLVAMGEIVALGLGVVLGDLLRSRLNLRLLTVIAIFSAAGMDLLTANVTGDGPLTAARALAGLAEGLLLWGAVSLIVQGPAPDRVAGVFMVVQTLAQALIAAALAFWVLPGQSVYAGFVFLGGLTAVSVLLVAWLPKRLAREPDKQTDASDFRWSFKQVLLLMLVFLQLSAIGALWAYLEPLGTHAGLAPQAAQLLVSAMLFMQVVSGCLGVLLVRRVPDYSMLAVVALLLASIALGMYVAADQGVTVFLGLCSLFALVYLMLTPFQVRIALQIDPSGRIAGLIPGMQLLGCAFGPLLASQWIAGDNAQPVLLVSAWFSVIALLLVGVLRRCPVRAQVGFARRV